MSDLVNINIDGRDVQVPAGSTVVDAAMRHGVHIPVFCHHPKLEPVGMCRMCLVRIGMPVRDRATRELVLDDDGNMQISWGRGLQTGCTVRVGEGMHIQTDTQEVADARDDIIEFILTSHPLDCPICDKGGECPLQNLTMDYGRGTSRFHFADKMKLDKHVPLGEMIYLDRERCIQCGRCTRFQAEIVDDPVIAFHNRGRRLEIVTLSDPGFDSYWSGNTTDICPVGALTTADFRFGARPWELTPAASISPHGPEGANITFSTRREAKSGGRSVIKRVMPRQNEYVNEIWIPDKARFAHHFVDAPDRLQTPLVRRGGQLVAASWEEALQAVADGLAQAATAAAGLAGERLSNEDYFAFQKLFRKGLKNDNIDLAHARLAGGDVTAVVGLASGSNLGDLGQGDAIVVVASDLHEEAPIWWLRVKQAADQRGATLVTLNLRPTRLDKYATHVETYGPGGALEAVAGLLKGPAGAAIREARNLVVFYGYEGLTYAESDAVARTLGNMLLDTGHAGKVNSGLVAVWPHNNTQGAWDMGVVNGFAPGYREVRQPGLDAAGIYAGAASGDVKALYVVGADPIGDGLMDGRGALDFLVVQELFLTETAQAADVVLPAQSFAERDGTYTSGERRVQRFFPAIERIGESRPDWQIVMQVAERMGYESSVPYAASLIFTREIAKGVRPYKAMSYREIGWTEVQYPIVGRDENAYYGGTSYENSQGLGLQWAASAESKPPRKPFVVEAPAPVDNKAGLQPVRVAAQYTPGTLINHSAVLAPRMAQPEVGLHAADAAALGVSDGGPVVVQHNGYRQPATARVADANPAGVALLRGFAWHKALAAAEITVAAESVEE